MKKYALLIIIMSCLGVQGAVWSFPYTGIYVFGDSLSDSGRLFAATQIPPPPYYQGRFSNGPIWIDYLGALPGFSAYQPEMNAA